MDKVQDIRMPEKGIDVKAEYDKQQLSYAQIHQNAKNIDILEMLHKKKMYVIEKCFDETGGKGLDIDQFCCVMLEHLEYDKTDSQKTKEVTIALMDLFKEIDVNGDGTMEWEEFSDHIISLGMLRNDRSFKNVIKNYYPSENIVDTEKHETGIEKVYAFDKLKSLIVLEKDSPKFKVYNTNKCEFLYEVNAHKCSVLAAEYLPNLNLLATSSNDLTINFWDGNSYNLKQIVSVPEIQLCMRYAQWSTGSKPAFLYTGGSDAIVHIYDAHLLKEKGTMSGWNPFFKTDLQQYGHAGPIGDILPIDCQSTLVTAGLDANICLWDIVTHSPKKNLKGHEKGIYSLDWSDWSPMNQFLFSAGLDHECFVWNTYVNEKIFLLRGHNHPLIGVKCLPGTPQVITADINGMVKIWDVRNFLCMQTITIPTDELSSFVVTNQQKKRIIFGSRRLTYYEYDEPKDHALTDEKMCLRVLYNDELLSFVTLHPDCIKIWNARDGSLQSVFRELSTAELTACVLDRRKRKLFVGDSEGRIFTVNIKNGAKLKNFQKHNKLITDLVHWTNIDPNDTSDDQKQDKDDTRRIVSSSREENVIIHDEDAQDSLKSCRYTIKQHKAQVNELSLKEGTEFLASVSDDGSIIITNLIGYRQEKPQDPQEAKDVQQKKCRFLNPHNCLATADNLGNIYFFGTHPSKQKNKLLMKKEYKTMPQTKSQQEKFPITAMAFNRDTSTLMLGDEFGKVEIWDLTKFLTKLNRIDEEDLKRKQQQQELQPQENGTLITQPDNFTSASDEIPFEDNDIEFLTSYHGAHKDGITWIEHVTIPEYKNCFATSSFDCCCHIWQVNAETNNIIKIGSLVLGHQFQDQAQDPNQQGQVQQTKQLIHKLQPWEVVINEEPRQKQAIDEADDMIKLVKNTTIEQIINKDKEAKEKNQKNQQVNINQTNSQKIIDKLQALENGKLKETKHENKQKKQWFGIKDDYLKKDVAQNLSAQERKQKILEKARAFQQDWTDYSQKMKKLEDKRRLNKNQMDRLNDKDLKLQYDWEGEEFNGEDQMQLDMDIYQDIDEDEEDDHHILSDLVDFKNQQNTGTISKSAFMKKK